MADHPSEKRTFSYEDAVALLPEVRRLTEEAYFRVASLGVPATHDGPTLEKAQGEIDEIVTGWASSLMALGVEIKGLWLVDFDNGSGYYCWRYPEEGLHYYHTYEEGFRGRMRIQ